MFYRVSVQRLSQKILNPLKLKEKQASSIITLQKKERELSKEADQLKKQIGEYDKKVKELVEVIESEVENKLKKNLGGVKVKIQL